ncbi:hypothetical protein TIFTF001_016078 [Ficus carica]|uniref:Uncharacterized protein n=1 Tax=Ficus carica TaxID=3494 RepID=A0AA88D5T6_FICCA|nr:hypothetical protein TIFTF001_016078 [Ficus carica]
MKSIEAVDTWECLFQRFFIIGDVIGSYSIGEGVPPSMESPEVEMVTSLGQKW